MSIFYFVSWVVSSVQFSGSVTQNSQKDFPGGPVVKTQHFRCMGHEFNPLSGNQDPICCRVQPKIGNKKNPLLEFTESCFRLLFFATKDTD